MLVSPALTAFIGAVRLEPAPAWTPDDPAYTPIACGSRSPRPAPSGVPAPAFRANQAPRPRVDVTLVNDASLPPAGLCDVARAMTAVLRHRMPDAARPTHVVLYPRRVAGRAWGTIGDRLASYYDPDRDDFGFSVFALRHPGFGVTSAQWTLVLAGHEASHRWQAWRTARAGHVTVPAPGPESAADVDPEVEATREGLAVASAALEIPVPFSSPTPAGEMSIWPLPASVAAYSALWAAGPPVDVRVRRVRSVRTWVRDRLWRTVPDPSGGSPER